MRGGTHDSGWKGTLLSRVCCVHHYGILTGPWSDAVAVKLLALATVDEQKLSNSTRIVGATPHNSKSIYIHNIWFLFLLLSGK